MNPFTNNPELKRNLWLELSLNRLIMMPVILCVLFLLIYLSSESFDSFIGKLRIFSMAIFYVLVYLWGTRLASEAIISEINDRTWDNQRITLLNPWKMSIGKLLGSTIYSWYGGLICIVLYCFAALFLSDTLQHFKFAVLMVMIGVFTHAVSLSQSLIGIRKSRNKSKIRSAFYLIMGIVLSGQLFSLALQVIESPHKFIYWYNFAIPITDFAIFTVVFFSFWSIVGLYRNMRTEFQLVNTPWVWIFFILSLMLYFAGLTTVLTHVSYLGTWSFVVGSPLLSGFYIAFGTAVVLTYYTVFSESKYIVEIKQLVFQFKKKEWNKFFSIAPLWLLALIFVFITCMITFFLSTIDYPVILSQNRILPTLFSVNIMFFVMRDLGLLFYLNLSGNTKRADITAIIYLVLLYTVVPAIISAGGMKNILPVFIPSIDCTLANQTIPLLIQITIIWRMLIKRYQKSIN